MLTGIRWIAMVAVLVLGAVAFVFSNAVRDTNQTLERVMNHDVAWSGTQGRHEAGSLKASALRLAIPESTRSARDDVRLAFEILESRVGIWGAGDFSRFLDTNQRARAHFDEFLQHMDRFGHELDQTPPNADRLVEFATSIKQLADRIGMQAHTASVNEIDAVRRSLNEKQSTQTILILSLFGMGVVLIGVTLVQNRSLLAATNTARDNADRFAHLAMHDPLTGLLNRSGFTTCYETFQHELSTTERLAVLALDLDGFKAINDTLGHGTGDALLNSVAMRLRNLISTNQGRSLVARPGGDEFLIALAVRSEKDALECANCLRESVCIPHQIDGGNVSVDVTIGVAISQEQLDGFEQLTRDADLALTNAKSGGKGSVCVFNNQMREDVVYHRTLEQEFDEALGEGQITLHFQPQIDLQTGAVVGAEALARWYHPERGWISPEEFIPIAESSGRIVDLGRTILSLACRRAQMLPDDIHISVNMSVVQLMREDTAEELKSLLASNGIKPSRLTIEVTESIVMSDTRRGLSGLKKLRNAGVRLALDDFGTGYSALSYLHLFPWDQLKIDRSFIQSMSQNRDSLAIVEHVISLAHRMGITVVAEGIEEQHQLDLLQQHQCNTGQGYLFSHPLSGEELDAFLARRMVDAA